MVVYLLWSVLWGKKNCLLRRKKIYGRVDYVHVSCIFNEKVLTVFCFRYCILFLKVYMVAKCKNFTKKKRACDGDIGTTLVVNKYIFHLTCGNIILKY